MECRLEDLEMRRMSPITWKLDLSCAFEPSVRWHAHIQLHGRPSTAVRPAHLESATEVIEIE